MAAAAVSLACPLRRSTRLAHAHSHAHPPHRRSIKAPRLHPNPEPDNEHDSSSSDPENELTPRALRALKRQRLALDLDGLPLTPRPRPRKRRKENSPVHQPLAPKHNQSSDARPSSFVVSDSCHSPRSTATPRAASPSSAPEPISNPALENRPSSHCDQPRQDSCKPELSIPVPFMAPDPSTPSSDSEPLTPLTPLTPSPEPSPCLPGHDRQALPPPSPPHDPLPPTAALVPLPIPEPTHPSTDSFPPPPIPPSLDPALDTLIPFDGLHSQFDPELSVQIPHPPAPPHLQGLELQQFHSFPQHQLYVPPNPVFVRDREINIWKLACQERVDCLLRRYGVDYIKALVESQAHSVSRETGSSPSGITSAAQSQTKFRLYTPASYTYSLSSWGSASGTHKAFPVDDQGDDVDPGWPMDDADWVDADIDMEDEDEDDYEDDDDAAEGETGREGETTLEAGEGLVVPETGPVKQDPSPVDAMDVDATNGPLTTKATVGLEEPVPPRPTPDPSLRPLTPILQPFPPPPVLTPPVLPLLSSLHVPLLSEPPRAFMGRGTPPDRRRLVEWSDSGRFATNGMGPPLYLSPVPQRPSDTDVGIVPMSVDPPIHTAPPHTQPHTPGEWTSFLYSMLEGDGVGVGVGVGIGANVVGAGHTSEPTWYELSLASVPPVVPEPVLELPPPHARTTPGPVTEPVDEGSNSSSTLRFALG